MNVLVLVKHGQPVLDGNTLPRDWVLSTEGELQASALAARLRVHAPCRLITSPEPKAVRTTEIIASGIAVPYAVRDALKELDRHSHPIVSAAEHSELNAEVFARRDCRVVGGESAQEALRRVSDTIEEEVAAATTNVIAVSHGTVISLFVAAHNHLDAFQLWRVLTCGSFVVLQVPTFRLIMVDQV